MKDLTMYHWIALILVIIGGINWLLIGLVKLNVVAAIFGEGLLARLIYIIIGLGAAYLCYLIYLEKMNKPAV